MDKIRERCLQFVLRYYRPNRLNTQAAYDRFLAKQGVDLAVTRRRALVQTLQRVAAIAIVASMIIGAHLYIKEQRSWTHLATSEMLERFTLPDSTIVTLAPHSQLSFRTKDFGSNARAVNLRGMAFFSVSRDEDRPFSVRNNHALVEVLGTSFLIEKTPSGTKLFVESGKVLFTAEGSARGEILTGGMHAHLGNDMSMPRIIHPKTHNHLSWRDGWFVYEATPLEDVLADLSDYYRVGLTSTAKGKQLTGRFDTKSLDDNIEKIEKVLGIEIEKVAYSPVIMK